MNERLPLSPPSRTHAGTAFFGGLGAASGGFAEVILSSVLSIHPRLPTLGALASQSSNLFFCFGTFTFISATYSTKCRLPPKPFPVILIIGATAGGVGSAILVAVEGSRGNFLARSALQGALVIGTVISAPGMTCADILQRIDG